MRRGKAEELELTFFSLSPKLATMMVMLLMERG